MYYRITFRMVSLYPIKVMLLNGPLTLPSLISADFPPVDGSTATASYFSSFAASFEAGPPVELRVKQQLTNHMTTAQGDIVTDCELLVAGQVVDMNELTNQSQALENSNGFTAALQSENTVKLKAPNNVALLISVDHTVSVMYSFLIH